MDVRSLVFFELFFEFFELYVLDFVPFSPGEVKNYEVEMSHYNSDIKMKCALECDDIETLQNRWIMLQFYLLHCRGRVPVDSREA